MPVAQPDQPEQPASIYNALAYYYATPSNGGSGTMPLSSFTLDSAGKLYDGSAFDTTTGYTTTITSNGSCFVYGLIDLGSSPPSVSAFEMTYAAPNANCGIIVGSNDGTTWSASLISGNASSATKTSLTATGTYRYYQCFTATGGGAGATSTLTDYRLYDTGGGVIGSPAPDFSISPTSQAVSVVAGGASVVVSPDLTVSGSPYTGTPSVTATGVPAGITVAPLASTVSAGGSVAVSYSASQGVNAGNYSATITVSDGTNTHTQAVTITVTVTPPATPTLGAMGQVSLGQSQIRLYGL